MTPVAWAWCHLDWYGALVGAVARLHTLVLLLLGAVFIPSEVVQGNDYKVMSVWGTGYFLTLEVAQWWFGMTSELPCWIWPRSDAMPYLFVAQLCEQAYKGWVYKNIGNICFRMSYCVHWGEPGYFLYRFEELHCVIDLICRWLGNVGCKADIVEHFGSDSPSFMVAWLSSDTVVGI